MAAGLRQQVRITWWMALALGLGAAGCVTPFSPICHIPEVNAPNEVIKAALPPYVIEPPDVLQVNAVQLVPKPPYKIKPLDVFQIQFPASPDVLTKDDVDNLLKTGRIVAGAYIVEPEGTFDLGALYGKVMVTGLTTDKAREAIEARITKFTKKELVEAGKVTLGLVKSRLMQQVLGTHLVRPDGTIGLGTYGAVVVTGLTIQEAKEAIEAHLKEYVLDPEIALDVAGFNSKVYYVVYDGAGFGEQVYRIPATGNETVLDAISQLNGLNLFSSRRRIWIARPALGEHAEDKILPVDWNAIVRGGSAKINYQIFPGDRIYVQAQPLVTFDNYLARLLQPAQRVMGSLVLGAGTYSSLRGGLGGATP